MSTLAFHVFAIAAAGVALVAAAVAVFSWRQVRRLRAGHMVVFGEGRADLVDFAVALQGRIDDLRQAVDEIAAALTRVDKRIDGTIENVAVVRYDAFGDHGGQQSATVALLDASRSGIIISSVQGRDYARIYTKELNCGSSAVALSPEEEEAVRRAMAR
jgi:hypothetical protein